jgi:nicotinamidase/pyrazinamidase
MTALVIIDAQNDFFPGGALAVPHGDEIVAPLNHMIQHAVQNEWEIFASRDWHPEQSEHFKEWPVHCVQNTRGAEFSPKILLPREYPKFYIVSKGTGDASHDYSFFSAHPVVESRTLVVGGLALEYCVLETVKDAVSLGYSVVLVTDACRALSAEDGERALQEMRDLGVMIATSVEVMSWREK